MQEEISLLDLWKMFKKHSLLIILCSIIGAILAGAFMFAFVDSQYASESQLIVNQKKDGESNIQYSDLQTSINLVNTYRDIILSPAVLSPVLDTHGLDMTADGLKDNISVEQSQNSQSFNVRLKMEDPQLAQNVLISILDEFKNRLEDIYQEEISSVVVLSEPSYNASRVSPSLIRYLLIGGLLGLMLSVLLAVIKELSDTTVKDADFLVGLGLISLGEVSSLTKKEREESRLGNQIKTRQASRRKV